MVKQLWYSKASKTQDFSKKYKGSTMKTPNVVVWHSTEGPSWPGYNGGATAPTFTIKPNFSTKKAEFRQHFPVNMSARALENRSGGVETNTANAVQIELVGTCDPRNNGKWKTPFLFTPQPPDWFLRDLAEFMVWLWKEWGDQVVKGGYRLVDAAPRGWFAYGADSRQPGRLPASYGASKARMSNKEWREDSYGNVGHQHVPENSHGDPGNFPMGTLVKMARELAGLDKPTTPTEPEQPNKITKSPYIVVAGDNLIRIAQRAGVDYEELLEWNNFDDPNKIYPGMEVIVQEPPLPEPPEETLPEVDFTDPKLYPPEVGAPTYGPTIQWLVSRLIAHESLTHHVDVEDDQYDRLLELDIHDFQEDKMGRKGSSASGQVDAGTLTALEAKTEAEKPVPPPTPNPWPPLATSLKRNGPKSDNVKKAQKKLGITEDGIFGPDTEKHVKIFQGRAQLPVTGVIDSKTWALLGAIESAKAKYMDVDIAIINTASGKEGYAKFDKRVATLAAAGRGADVIVTCELTSGTNRGLMDKALSDYRPIAWARNQVTYLRNSSDWKPLLQTGRSYIVGKAIKGRRSDKWIVHVDIQNSKTGQVLTVCNIHPSWQTDAGGINQRKEEYGNILKIVNRFHTAFVICGDANDGADGKWRGVDRVEDMLELNQPPIDDVEDYTVKKVEVDKDAYNLCRFFGVYGIWADEIKINKTVLTKKATDHAVPTALLHIPEKIKI